LCQEPDTLLCAILIIDFRISFEYASSSVRVLCPRPAPFGRVKDLAVQKGYDQLLKKNPEIEFWLKEFALFQRTTKTSAIVLLIEVPLRNRFESFDI
jgi:hypothetical protein